MLRLLLMVFSHWAMMNQDTRRLSKMPDDVRAEISPYFIERSVMINNDNTQDESEVYTCQRITKLDNSAPYIRSGLAVCVNCSFKPFDLLHVKI